MPIWPDSAEFQIRIREMTTDVGDVERAKDRSVRLAFEQEAEALFDQALCICFRLTSLPLGGDAVAQRLRGTTSMSQMSGSFFVTRTGGCAGMRPV
jgi:hypothetical protein